MRDQVQWWRRVMMALDVIEGGGGSAGRHSNGNVQIGIPNFASRRGTEDVAPVNRLMALFEHYADVLYRLAYNWTPPAQQAPAWINRPNRLLEGGFPSLDEVRRRSHHHMALNLTHLLGKPSDRVEFKFLAGTLDLAAVQAQIIMAAGLLVSAKRGA